MKLIMRFKLRSNNSLKYLKNEIINKFVNDYIYFEELIRMVLH